MDKTFLVKQLHARVSAHAKEALRTAEDSRQDAKSGANRAVNLARGTNARAEAALKALDDLELFKPKPLNRGQPIGLGAIVEVEGDTGGKTLFLAPCGAGEEVEGPNGDGFFFVVTPASPLGRAVMGKRVGDVVETTVDGEPAEWEITFAA